MVTRFHLVNEDNLKNQCAYCGTEINSGSWESVFYINRHYKSIKCKCGKENVIRVDFIGCGHDSEWSSKIPLDKKAKDVVISKFDELVEKEHNKLN
jgi:hypothetical protein